MTTGLSGTYGFNGVDLTLQPTTGRWVERTQYGLDAGAHPVYSSLRSFELTWELISPSDLNQIINVYNAISNTGNAVACLPKWNDSTYTFYNYSGTTIEEPQVGTFFMGYYQEVRMLVLAIRT